MHENEVTLKVTDKGRPVYDLRVCAFVCALDRYRRGRSCGEMRFVKKHASGEDDAHM
jgi:hypothetical protein